MYSFPDLEPVCCSMSSSNCCFLTCIQISQEAGKVVWYSHLLKYFPQFVVIYTVKGFGIINKAEVGVFLVFSCFFNDPTDVGNLISGSSAFSKSSLNIVQTKPCVHQDSGERSCDPTRHWPRLACECLGVYSRGVSQRWPAAESGARMQQCGTFRRRFCHSIYLSSFCLLSFWQLTVQTCSICPFMMV